MTRRFSRLAKHFRRQRLVLESLERRDVPSFAASQAFLAGPTPADVVGADLNGDGLNDLAVANNSTPGFVNVLLNSGGGTFAAAKSYPTGGSSASSLLVSDVSGDGKLDLVVTNYNSGTVAVLRGSGTGVFRRPVTFAAGLSPTSVAIADFNNDAVTDLAVTNKGNGASVLLGLGAGSFQLASSYDIGTVASDSTVGDFNGDGRADIVVVGNHPSAPKIVVLLGNGDGTLQFGAQYNTGSPIEVVSGDFDGDNQLDIAVANYTSHTISVWLGNGDGTLGFASSYFGATYHATLDALDADDDGIQDLVVTDWYQGTLKLLPGHGNGLFGPATSYQCGVSPAGVALSDFTGDGIADFAVINGPAGTGTVTLLPGLGSGVFPDVIPPTYFAGNNTRSVTSADLNGDSDPDLAVTDGTDVSVLLGQAGGTFGTKTTYHLPNSANGVTAADFNTDGQADLAIGASSFGLAILLNTGSGFAPPVVYSGANVGALVAADFNTDGFIDIAGTSSFGNGPVSVFLGNGDGSFAMPLSYGVGSKPIGVVVGDFNEDAQLDLVVTNSASATISILLGNGDGTFQNAVNVAAGDSPYSVAVADFNGDGNVDLAAANNLGVGTVSVFFGNGDGTFSPHLSYSVGAGSISVIAADLNGDGKPDLAVANSLGGTVSVLLNDGSGAFQPPLVYLVTTLDDSPISLTVADFDADGWVDLGALYDAGVGVLLNAADWPPLPIGDGPRPVAPLDLGETTDTLDPTIAQTQTSKSTTINVMDVSITTMPRPQSYASRHLGRVALAETTESEIDLFSTKLS